MEWVALLLFASVILLLLAGFPVAFSLGGTALIFALFGVIGGGFESAFLTALPSRIFGIMSNETLVAVPLFVFMGITLERAQIAEDLLDTLSSLFGRVRGGLGISVTLVGMLLAGVNGFEAMDDIESGRRTLTAEVFEVAGHDVQVTVRDCGAGLDSKKIDRIFEPFYTTKPDGMGMGLAINRSIIEAHGGRLWVEAVADRGATFHFCLPIADTSPTP